MCTYMYVGILVMIVLHPEWWEVRLVEEREIKRKPEQDPC